MAAPIAELIDSLPIKDDKIEVLTDLKALLGNISNQTLASVVANVSFNSVFDCLTTDDREQLELSCDVLKKLFSPLPCDIILTQFQEELKTGLKHPEIAVRKLCLYEVARVSKECVHELARFEEVVIQVVKTLADESLDVAKSATEILVNLGLIEEGLTVLYTGSVFTVLQDVLNSNDTIRFRVYEVMISICCQSLVGLQKTSECGILQQFINELHKDDILIQLNCLELLSDLAVTEHGLSYLETQGITSKLEELMMASQSDPLAGFLVPGLVKFFGCVAKTHPKEVCSKNEAFVTTVFTNLSNPENENMLSLSIQTIGFIGHTIEGKLALEKLGSRMDTGVHCIGKALRESQQDGKIIILQALASLLKLKVADQTSELLKLTQHWYAHLGSQTFNYLMTISTHPFPELRWSLLSLFLTLASQPWAQSIMNNHPGFREYLLDRSTEKTKECKERKYMIVSTLAESPTSGEIFGQPYLIQLKVYCNQGPFYVRVQSEVAMEGE